MDKINEKLIIFCVSILMKSNPISELVNIINNLVSEIDEVRLLNSRHNVSKVV